MLTAGGAQAYEQYSRLELGPAAWAGLTRIAGFLLVVFSPARAEDAFWTLVALAEDRLPASCVLKVRSACCGACACVPLACGQCAAHVQTAHTL